MCRYSRCSRKGTVPVGMRRTAAGIQASPAGMHPIFFLRHQKENAPCTVEKKKCLFQPFTYVQGWGNVFCENFYAGEGVHTKSRAGCGKSLIRYAVLMEHQISGCK